jgi:hypothetical protein
LLKGNTLTVPPVNGLKPLVQGVSYQKGFLFIGTNLGLFSLQVSQTDGSLPPLPGDATKLKPADPVQFPRIANIVRVRSTTLASGVVATAALTRNGELFILKDGVVAGEYRFFMGLPFEPGEREAGKTADLFWTEKGLVVTGTNGVVELPVDKL